MKLLYFLDYLILPMLSVAALLVVYRFIKGPSLADRVIAVDLLFIIGIAITTAFSLLSGESLFLDIATLFSLIGFLSTTAFAYYLVKKSKKSEKWK